MTWNRITHHWSLRMSKHIAPVTELMLGCQIFVINRTCVQIKQKVKEKSYAVEQRKIVYHGRDRSGYMSQITSLNVYLGWIKRICFWDFNF